MLAAGLILGFCAGLLLATLTKSTLVTRLEDSRGRWKAAAVRSASRAEVGRCLHQDTEEGLC